VARGESPQDAASAARREMGNLATIAELTREMWGWTCFDRLLQDVRYWRTSRMQPSASSSAMVAFSIPRVARASAQTPAGMSSRRS
jgi:hypothetical protein